MTLKEIYAAFAALTRSDPTGRLRTFSPISSRDEINDKNLGRDPGSINHAYYYSARWEESRLNPSQFSWELPAVFMWCNVVDDQQYDDCMVEAEFSVLVGCGMPGRNEASSFGESTIEGVQQALLGAYNYLFSGLEMIKLHSVVVESDSYLVPYLLGSQSTAAGVEGKIWLTSQFVVDEPSIISASVGENFHASVPGNQVLRGALTQYVYDLIPMCYMTTFRAIIDLPPSSHPVANYPPLEKTYE